MKIIQYGKQPRVPKFCPDCGCGELPATSITDVTSLLKSWYSHWRVYKAPHPTMGLTQWYGSCGRCIMEFALKDSNMLIWRSLKTKERESFSGGTFTIPMGK